MKESTITHFDILSDWLEKSKQKVMVTEPQDIEKALYIAKDTYMMYERGLINDKEFLRQYTTISENGLFFEIDKVDFPIVLSVASIMKYGGKDLLKRLILMLEENKNSKIIRIKLEPK